RRPHRELATLGADDDRVHPAVTHLDPARLAAIQDLGPIAASIDQVGPQGGLLGAPPAAETASPAVPTAAHVSGNGPEFQVQLAQATLQRRIRPVAWAFAGIDLQRRFDGRL